MPIPTKPPKICCIPGCSSPLWACGRCGIHSQELKRNCPKEFERLRLLLKSDRKAAHHEFYLTKNPPPPQFEWEGDEKWLINRDERRTRYLAERPDSETLLTFEELDDLIEAEDRRTRNKQETENNGE
jgi:hypothetical protein